MPAASGALARHVQHARRMHHGRRFALPVSVFLAATAGCHRTSVPLPELSHVLFGDTADLVSRGAYIVRNAAVCGQCHAAEPRRDPDGPLSGGMEFKDWRIGTARAANLTPDTATGLGTWSDAEIVRALRNGQRKDGRLMTPVMPYEWLHLMSDRDAVAVARYLKSLAPIRHQVRQSPSIWLRLGRAFFLGAKAPVAVSEPPRSATAAYGGYVSRHVALCADCHTALTGLRSKPDRRRVFAGWADPPGVYPENPANITPDSATGIGLWSEQDFLTTLHSGVNPRGDSLHPFMPWRQVRRMTDTDLRAIYRYLRTVPPIQSHVPRR
jgi:cytochrome c553